MPDCLAHGTTSCRLATCTSLPRVKTAPIPMHLPMPTVARMPLQPPMHHQLGLQLKLHGLLPTLLLPPVDEAQGQPATAQALADPAAAQGAPTLAAAQGPAAVVAAAEQEGTQGLHTGVGSSDAGAGAGDEPPVKRQHVEGQGA